MQRLCKTFLLDETGVTAIEYGMIAGLIAAVIIGSVRTLGSNVSNMFSNIAANIH
jgi:pilus assembly protein Flp/PilA